MSNWLEKIHSLSAGMLFTQGHLLPVSRDEPARNARGGRQPNDIEKASLMQCCADAARAIVQRPRLIQPH